MRQHAGQDRQRVDTRVKHAQPAGFPDPCLVRVPAAHVFFPLHVDGDDGAACQPLPSGLDTGCVARMPRGKQGAAALPRQFSEDRHFRHAGARRLLQHHVLACSECRAGLDKPHLWWRTQRHRTQRGFVSQHGVERRVMRQAVNARMRARAGREREAGLRGECRQMLIACNLADANNADRNGGTFTVHGYRPQRRTSGSSRRAMSIRPRRVSGCIGGNGWRDASQAITPPSFISALAARMPACRFS